MKSPTIKKAAKVSPDSAKKPAQKDSAASTLETANKTKFAAINTAMSRFLEDGNFSAVQSVIKKSRATIYRYAKIVRGGGSIVDGRSFGNNRLYGKNKKAS